MLLSPTKHFWLPRLLLGGLVVVLVFGACASVKFTRKDSRLSPLEIRYTVKRKGLLLFFFPTYDTVAVNFFYNKRRVATPNTCSAADEVPIITRIRRQPGPEPRWLLTVHCGYQAQAYLLRVPPSGPEYHYLSSVPNENWRNLLRPIQPDTYLYLATSDSVGTLFDLRTNQRHAVQLPALAEGRWRNNHQNPWHTVSPDGRWIGRAFSLDTTTYYRPANQPRKPQRPLLVLDQSNLATGERQRLRLPGVWIAPAQLPQSVRWVLEAGQWKLRPNP